MTPRHQKECQVIATVADGYALVGAAQKLEPDVVVADISMLGLDGMAAFAEEVYGVPPEQVVGSVGETRSEMRDGKGVLVKLPKPNHVDDKEGKPVGVGRFIGRRPLMAFGNSDGDLQMLQYTTTGPGPRFGLIVHHTDGQREVAYDRTSHIGKLDKALDEASRGRGSWRALRMTGRRYLRRVDAAAMRPTQPRRGPRRIGGRTRAQKCGGLRVVRSFYCWPGQELAAVF